MKTHNCTVMTLADKTVQFLWSVRRWKYSIYTEYATKEQSK